MSKITTRNDKLKNRLQKYLKAGKWRYSVQKIEIADEIQPPCTKVQGMKGRLKVVIQAKAS